MPGLWTKFLTFFAGAATAGAAQDVAEPVFEPVRQNAWARRPYRVLDPELAASLLVRADTPEIPGIPLGDVDVADDAQRQGVGSARFELLAELSRAYPTLGELLTLRRRAIEEGDAAGITQDEFRGRLRRQGFSPDAIADLTKLLTGRLAAADVANAVQQGFLPNENILPADPGGDPPFTPPVTVVDINPLHEAYDEGVDEKRLRVLAELSGNPPGPMELLEMWRRGIITKAAVEHGIREGRTKTKWTSAYLALKGRLLDASVLVNLRLRGWIEDREYHDRMEKHGYGPGEADDWFDSAGRPMSPVQAFNAWSRKAPHVYEPGEPPRRGTFDFEDFAQAIKRSDIRPEYVDALWALRFSYPSLFQLRRAVQDQSFTPERASEILHIERYEKQDADALIRSWTAPTATTAKGLTATDLAAEYEGLYIDRAEYVADLQRLGFNARQAEAKAESVDARRVRTARNQAIARIRTVYVGHRITRDEAAAALDLENLPAAARDLVLAEWDHEREVNVAVLTPTQIKRAYHSLPAAWPRQRAIDELLFKGYTLDAANTFLDETP